LGEGLRPDPAFQRFVLRDPTAAWPGGLLVVSHDPEFLDAIGISRTLAL